MGVRGGADNQTVGSSTTVKGGKSGFKEIVVGGQTDKVIEFSSECLNFLSEAQSKVISYN